MLRGKKGQSTLEYVIIFAAIIGAVIIVAGRMGSTIQGSLNHASDEMGAKIYELDLGNSTANGDTKK